VTVGARETPGGALAPPLEHAARQLATMAINTAASRRLLVEMDLVDIGFSRSTATDTPQTEES